MTDALVCLVTAPDPDTAARLARTVVEERLAACGNIVPGLRSVYRWEGAVHDEPEVLIVFKTTRDAADRLRVRVVELHPYSCPEFLAFEVASGHPAYLAWLSSQVTG